jgi:ABC-type branched-subunit amino acid transport system ATPase component/ABC-type branched-subunit amino acid transport system permease subunit
VRDRPVVTTTLLAALLLVPVLPGMPYDVLTTTIIGCGYLVVALSLVLLIGLLGQISLCQATFVGMGAFVSAIATRQLGVHFPFTLVVGAAAGGLVASALGLVALRVRGLYLAVATLIFAYVADQYLFVQPWLVESLSGTSIKPEAIGRRGTIPFFDLSDAHVFYYVALAVALLVLYAVANLRDSRTGRAFAAVRGSEVAAASLGIDVVRMKLVGFATSGAIAGIGGALTLAGQRTVAPAQFSFTASLFFLAIAVVGGLRSIGGSVVSSALFAVLVGEVFYRSPKLADYLDLVTAGLLVVVLLFFRGGLGAVPERWRAGSPRLHARLRRVRDLAERTPLPRLRAVLPRLRARPLAGGPAAAASDPLDPIAAVVAEQHRRRARPTVAVVRTEAHDGEAAKAALRAASGVAGAQEPVSGRRTPLLLDARGITVRFGGLTAVSDASLAVGAGEIVGLIGPNGAGKTTLFNAVLGLNSPAAGTVALFGDDVTGHDVHERAALGVGRTFQVIQLFGDLSVFDNLLVATHLQNPTGLLGGILGGRRARERERAARDRVRAVLAVMELEEYADRAVGQLPFGVLRLVEVARTVVTGAKLICLDEPASGLDSAETERLIEWLRLLREIGFTLLVIEHDVDMVTRLCDHIYVLDQGRLIASGTPAEVRNDAAVVASYLGTAVEEVA